MSAEHKAKLKAGREAKKNTDLAEPVNAASIESMAPEAPESPETSAKPKVKQPSVRYYIYGPRAELIDWKCTEEEAKKEAQRIGGFYKIS